MSATSSAHEQGCAVAAFDTAYLSLPLPRLVLDLRPPAEFAAAHIAHSTHIHPLADLKARYSCLPPRFVPFLVLANQDQRDDVRSALNGCLNARLMFLQDENGAVEPGSSSHIDTTCEVAAFDRRIEELGLLRRCEVAELKRRTRSTDDWPALLFLPSKAVRRLVEGNLLYEQQHGREQAGTASSGKSVLDLGCGAGRDLAWILYGSQRESNGARPPPRWNGVGVDNWKAVLTRTALLMGDLDLSRADEKQSSECSALVWAKCTDDGFLEPLVGTGKGKAFNLPPLGEEEEIAWQTFRRAGLASLSSLQNEEVEPSDAGVYDLVLSIRFYPSALLRKLRRLVKPGGAILVSHFTTATEEERRRFADGDGDGDEGQRCSDVVFDYDSPPLDGRICPGHAEEIVAAWNEEEGRAGTTLRWAVRQNMLEPIEDGRTVRSIVLQRSDHSPV